LIPLYEASAQKARCLDRLDAMAHGFEAFLTKIQSPYSYGILIRAIELIYKNIRDFTHNRMNKDACEKMCWAPLWAG
jgi:alcohol dehydrogenase class IV